MMQERRQYLRIKTPVTMRIITKGDEVCQTKTKDISPLGLRFENESDIFNVGDIIELRIEIPNALSPVHAKAKVVWKKETSPEPGSPTDIGCEFTDIEEDNKNTFLKYFCDLLYERGREAGRKGE